MRRLSWLISLGLLAACGQTTSAPASEAANEAGSAANDSAPASATDNAAADTGMANATDAPTPAASETEKPASVASLPLKRGFYLASDTPCGRASNATLSLLGRDGFTVSGRDFCAFVKIEKTGATGYRVTEECSSGGEAWGTEEQKDTSVVAWEIPNDTSYKRKSDSGWESSARYCAQSSLPEPWRDNDISDLIK